MSEHYSNEQIDTLIELLNRMRNQEFNVYEFHKVIKELDNILLSEQQLKDSLTRYKGLSRPKSDIQP
jgi:hypothetical protein